MSSSANSSVQPRSKSKKTNDLILYENKEVGIKFQYPKKWDDGVNEKFSVVKIADFVVYPGCVVEECATKYNQVSQQWATSDGTISGAADKFAFVSGVQAYSIAIKGAMNCGKYTVAFPYKGYMISRSLSLCNKPTSENELQVPDWALVYENESDNMKKTLESIEKL